MKHVVLLLLGCLLAVSTAGIASASNNACKSVDYPDVSVTLDVTSEVLISTVETSKAYSDVVINDDAGILTVIARDVKNDAYVLNMFTHNKLKAVEYWVNSVDSYKWFTYLNLKHFKVSENHYLANDTNYRIRCRYETVHKLDYLVLRFSLT